MDENRTPADSTEDVEAHVAKFRVADDAEAHMPFRRVMDPDEAGTATSGHRGPADTEDDTEAHMPYRRVIDPENVGTEDDAEAHASRFGVFGDSDVRSPGPGLPGDDGDDAEAHARVAVKVQDGDDDAEAHVIRSGR